MVSVSDQAVDQMYRLREGLHLVCSMEFRPICRLETSSFGPQSFLPRRKPLWQLATQSHYGAKDVVDVRVGTYFRDMLDHRNTGAFPFCIHHLGKQCRVRAWKVHVCRYQQSCFGLTLLESLPMPQSNYPDKQQFKPAQTQTWHLQWHICKIQHSGLSLLLLSRGVGVRGLKIDSRFRLVNAEAGKRELFIIPSVSPETQKWVR